MEASRHNLPTRLTPLIGRQVETATVLDLVADERLVTLVGTGGVGKSRLALRVAEGSIERFDGGVWWVDLAPLREPGSVPEAVLAAATLAQHSGRDAVETVAAGVQDRATMFVLDNCEHLIDTCAVFIDAVLQAAPMVVFLATSREPLGVSGEVVWRVPSLAVPDLVEVDTAEAIGRSDACQLFMERARRARPGLHLNDEVAGSVAGNCRQLDGIPLAIELAAARCRNLSVDRIDRELADRLRLLTGGVRTAHAHQQTLEASIDWSYARLDPDEQATLRRLGVFAGSFTIESAAAVTSSFGDVDPAEVLNLLDRLADKSLVVFDDDGSGEFRYRLLDTIRQYAVERLHELSETPAARDAHATYWAAWATGHNLYLDIGVDTAAAVRANRADLMVATRWACDERPDLVVALVESVGLFVSPENDGLFVSALAALDGIDEIAWTHVASAAYMTRHMMRGLLGSDEIVDRTHQAAEKLDLPSARARIAYTDAVVSANPEALTPAAELYRKAGAFTWSADCSLRAARYLVARGQIERSDELMQRVNETGKPANFATDVSRDWRCQRALVVGQLSGVAPAEREALEAGEWATQSMFGFDLWTSGWSHESLARVAFFSEDLAVLEWVAEKLEDRADEGAGFRRVAALAAAHAILLRDGPAAAPIARDRLESSVIGGGILRRETPYLAVAGADPGWLRSERDAIQPWAGEDIRVEAFTHLCDAVLAWQSADYRGAERHWHDLLAVASEHGFGLLWIDALEGLSICAARAGSAEEAGRLSGAAETARTERGYRYSYPHVSALPAGSEDGRGLSLEEATAYAQRARVRRSRPATGWEALTSTEVEVAQTVAEGLTNKQTAERLFMSVPTVKTHLRHIYAKLDIDNRAQLVTVVADQSP